MTILNPKPETLDPKPQTLDTKHVSSCRECCLQFCSGLVVSVISAMETGAGKTGKGKGNKGLRGDRGQRRRSRSRSVNSTDSTVPDTSVPPALERQSDSSTTSTASSSHTLPARSPRLQRLLAVSLPHRRLQFYGVAPATKGSGKGS